MKSNKRVLVVATSARTRGGITSVINGFKSTNLWTDWNCIWIETHIDRNVLIKILYFVRSLIRFVFFLNNATIVHFHLSGRVSAIRKLPFILLSRHFKKPIIIHFHAFSPNSSIPEVDQNLYKRLFSYANKLVLLSNNWKLNIMRDLEISPSKISVIYNPCQTLDSTLQEIGKKKIVLYAGTLNTRKGYLNLIRAYAKIAQSNKDWKLVFAGNGDIDKAKQIVDKLKISNQVEFLGWITGSKKHAIFSEASIFCLPSYAEGFPMAVLDAWSYGLPVITTPVGGITDIAINGENMLLFEPEDIEQLAKHLQELISNIPLREKLIKSSLSFSKNKFSLNTIIKDWDNLYYELAQSR